MERQMQAAMKSASWLSSIIAAFMMGNHGRHGSCGSGSTDEGRLVFCSFAGVFCGVLEVQNQCGGEDETDWERTHALREYVIQGISLDPSASASRLPLLYCLVDKIPCSLGLDRV